jgi:glycine cleavage system transcriptional repressor
MSDTRYIVIAGLGPDRPGIVAESTWFLTERGANVEDSRALVLGGEFGLMILASGNQEALRRVTQDLGALEHATGLLIVYRNTVSPEEHRAAKTLPYVVEASAMDHEGIVHAVSQTLYDAGINIVELETTVLNAPITGTPLFKLVARVDLPGGISAETVREALVKVARQHNLDVELRPHYG